MPKKPARLLVLFALLMIIVGADQIYRYWRPDLTIQTDHYTIYSTATAEQTKQIGDVVELLYKSYHNTFTDLANVHKDHKKLKLKLFKDRKEFRRCNRVGWAEAFYKKPYCNAYYSAVIQKKGTFRSFEEHIGPIDRIQSQWYQYLIEQQKKLCTGRFLPTAPSKQNHPDPNS